MRQKIDGPKFPGNANTFDYSPFLNFCLALIDFDQQFSFVPARLQIVVVFALVGRIKKIQRFFFLYKRPGCPKVQEVAFSFDLFHYSKIKISASLGLICSSIFSIETYTVV